MIPVDLTANCEGWDLTMTERIGIQTFGIKFRDTFSGSTHMTVPLLVYHGEAKTLA